MNGELNIKRHEIEMSLYHLYIPTVNNTKTIYIIHNIEARYVYTYI